jgi:UDP-N-acetylglucosamine diphosphorylase / glucose-1-phosphate thymidylyltransferase / UDP-N-acetylgalactosamine diphosphorylase / glucosamine-1-phosphate N-acetyltransferase / galactosamine-1-phosphate N-acetyltransferase
MNIVIPMAGQGSRFVQAGYEKPKPFIDVNGKPMIVRVMENLHYPGARYFLIGRREHLDSERAIVQEIEKNYNAVFIPIEKLTEGTACTVLFARQFINNDAPLVIANSDQLVDGGIQEYIDDCFARKLDGSILTFIDEMRDPKWSFAKIDDHGLVTDVKEKIAISEFATVGIYLFSKGKSFVNGAIDMIINNDRVKNEFYTAPVYNYAVKAGEKIGIFNIEPTQMHGLGIPEDLEYYVTKVLR